MHFSEIRGVALLTILLTVGIMLADRFAPAGMSRPAETVTTAMKAAERTATAAREQEEAAASVRASPATSGGGSSPLAASVTASGYSCPTVRRVVPISGGNGIYRVTCGDAGAETSYRIDTRRGGATPETGPVA